VKREGTSHLEARFIFFPSWILDGWINVQREVDESYLKCYITWFSIYRSKMLHRWPK